MRRIARRHLPTDSARATIVAFDGLVADTVGARALALADAVSAEHHPLSAADAASLLVGRSLEEAAEAALSESGDTAHAHRATHDYPFDPTTRDLVVLRARRHYGAIAMQGLSIRNGVAHWLTNRAASHGRLVLRADSGRREVEQLLRWAGLLDLFTLLRCADDLPRVTSYASTDASWHVIHSRLDAFQINRERRIAFEYDSVGAAAASPFVADVKHVNMLTINMRTI